MARGINKVILIGHCGANPEVRHMPSGDPVTTISLATSESWKNKQTGQPEDRTEWHRVVFFGRLAEIAGEYLRKGSKVYIDGKLRTRKWQDQNNQDRYTTEIVANEMQMLDSRANGQSGDYNSHYNQSGYNQVSSDTTHQPSATPSQSSLATEQAQASGAAPAGNFDNFDDDIPF